MIDIIAIIAFSWPLSQAQKEKRPFYIMINKETLVDFINLRNQVNTIAVELTNRISLYLGGDIGVDLGSQILIQDIDHEKEIILVLIRPKMQFSRWPMIEVPFSEVLD